MDSLTQLRTAAGSGDLVDIQRAIATGAEINTCSPFEPRDAAIHVACRHGRLDAVQFLVIQGADPHLLGGRGGNESSVFLAAESGNVDIVKFLIDDCGCNIDECDEEGFTPVHVASEKGHLEVVKYLVEKQCDHEKANDEGVTPILASAREGQFDVLSYLIAAGSKIDHADEEGFTALAYAAQEGQVDAVRMLVRAKCNKEVVDYDGNTALLLAAHRGKLGVIQYLVRHKCAVDTKNNEGLTALSIACREGHQEVAHFLSDISLDESAIRVAFQYGHIQLAQELAYKNISKVKAEQRNTAQIKSEPLLNSSRSPSIRGAVDVASKSARLSMEPASPRRRNGIISALSPRAQAISSLNGLLSPRFGMPLNGSSTARPHPMKFGTRNNLQAKVMELPLDHLDSSDLDLASPPSSPLPMPMSPQEDSAPATVPLNTKHQARINEQSKYEKQSIQRQLFALSKSASNLSNGSTALSTLSCPSVTQSPMLQQLSSDRGSVIPGSGMKRSKTGLTGTGLDSNNAAPAPSLSLVPRIAPLIVPLNMKLMNETEACNNPTTVIPTAPKPSEYDLQDFHSRQRVSFEKENSGPDEQFSDPPALERTQDFKLRSRSGSLGREKRNSFRVQVQEKRQPHSRNRSVSHSGTTTPRGGTMLQRHIAPREMTRASGSRSGAPITPRGDGSGSQRGVPTTPRGRSVDPPALRQAGSTLSKRITVQRNSASSNSKHGPLRQQTQQRNSISRPAPTVSLTRTATLTRTTTPTRNSTAVARGVKSPNATRLTRKSMPASPTPSSPRSGRFAPRKPPTLTRVPGSPRTSRMSQQASNPIALSPNATTLSPRGQKSLSLRGPKGVCGENAKPIPPLLRTSTAPSMSDVGARPSNRSRVGSMPTSPRARPTPAANKTPLARANTHSSLAVRGTSSSRRSLPASPRATTLSSTQATALSTRTVLPHSSGRSRAVVPSSPRRVDSAIAMPKSALRNSIGRSGSRNSVTFNQVDSLHHTTTAAIGSPRGPKTSVGCSGSVGSSSSNRSRGASVDIPDPDAFFAKIHGLDFLRSDLTSME